MLIDIIVLVILGVSGFVGYKKGLAGILVSVIALLLSIVLAVFLQNTVANYLYNETSIGTSLQTSFKDMLTEQIEKNKDSTELENDNSFIYMFFDKDELSKSMVESGAKQMTTFVLKGISFVAIFVLVFVICYILRMLLNIVFSLPILNSINKIGGVGLNLLKTLFKIWIVLAIISFIGFIPMIDNLCSLIESSILTKLLYDNNLIIIILKSTLHF
jgi:hypothetical protein